ncbi:hypothetical protein TNCV_1815821 [Trichonephila clavipes]|nr:hypothetical protein TNCV_1815821 [Trichonephila clavipes]
MNRCSEESGDHDERPQMAKPRRMKGRLREAQDTFQNIQWEGRLDLKPVSFRSVIHAKGQSPKKKSQK